MASKQNADKPQRKRTQRFNHPFASLLPNGHPRSRPSGLLAIYALSRYVLRSLEDTEQRVVKKNHVGSSCHQYLPIRLMYKSEGREHGQQSPALMCDIVGHASRRGRVGRLNTAFATQRTAFYTKTCPDYQPYLLKLT